MSTYERYDKNAATVYDKDRVAVGAEVIAGCLTAAPKPLMEVELLDAGCGTGVYTAALAQKVGHLVGIDISEEMLAIARSKLSIETSSERVSLQRGSILDLPFPDRSFDGVMFNQVLHHLESGEDPQYQAHARALTEAYRVLRTGGVLVANICTHEQVREGYWYYDLIPNAREGSIKRGAPAQRILKIFAEIGFVFKGRIVPLDGVMQGSAYFNPRGPLDANWRRLDSIWSLASKEEIAQAEARIRELDRQGLLMEYMNKQDESRHQRGQFTFFMAIRPD
jgi:ubiquinone/menaquinone biosynthesis C-methylase UbiE